MTTRWSGLPVIIGSHHIALANGDWAGGTTSCIARYVFAAWRLVLFAELSER